MLGLVFFFVAGLFTMASADVGFLGLPDGLACGVSDRDMVLRKCP